MAQSFSSCTFVAPQLGQEEDCTQMIKNTFITLQLERALQKQRRASVPAASQLCRGSRIDSDASTACSDRDVKTSDSLDTDASTACSECDVKTPDSLDNYCFERADYEDTSISPQNRWQTPPSALGLSTNYRSSLQFESMQSAMYQSSSTAGSQCGQCMIAEEEMLQPPPGLFNQDVKFRFVEVVKHVKSALQESAHVAQVEVSGDIDGWFITIRPQTVNSYGQAETSLTTRTAQVMAIAKEALVQATSQVKRTHLLGHCGPLPFVPQPQGFKATLAIMEDSRSACYHLFKKGWCRHGAACCKEHPSIQAPIHILVESAQLEAYKCSAVDFKQDVADIAMAAVATLSGCAYADKVEAFKDQCQGWTVEVAPKEELKPQREHLLQLAKNALFNAAASSKTAYIMGNASKPFVAKSQGFVTMVGDMQDESKACWDFYSKGFCTRGCECKWAHAECLMPINVVIKEKSSLRCSPAALEYLVCKGFIAAQ